MIFFNRGDGVQALNELTRATELDSQDSEDFHLHARVLCALGRYDEAIAVQKQSTAINPFEHPGAMAEIYICTRQFDAAISDGEMRLKDFPVAADILEQLADGYHWRGMDKEAVEMLAREFQLKEIFPCRPLFAVHSRPADTLLWFVASWLRSKRGREPEEFLPSRLQTCTGGSVSTMRLLPCSSKV